tara:strand:+ start:45 stop:179 length:135 start_codon:yes stop_codon:yes gene_type:complete
MRTAQTEGLLDFTSGTRQLTGFNQTLPVMLKHKAQEHIVGRLAL